MLAQADAFRIPLPARSVHCVVTSPPYWGLRKYAGEQGEEPLGLESDPERHIERTLLWAREVYRVLREDGVLWLNYGDCYSAASTHGGDDKVGPIDSRATTKGDRQYRQDSVSAGNLMLMPHRIALALQADGWVIRQDLVWCLSGGAFVYAWTQKGVMPMMVRDLVRLDPTTVQLWNGTKWTQVLGYSESPRPKHPLEIVLKSGERIGCTPNHQWPTERGLLAASDLVPGDIIQRTELPDTSLVDEPEHIPHTAGWLVGLYLAEGSRSGNTLQFSGHVEETERWRKLDQWAYDYGGTARLYSSISAAATMHVDCHPMRAVIDLYVAGKTSKNKHLTTAAWQRSNDFLRQVLYGYLDGDGHYDEPNNRWRLGFTNNDYLAQNLRTIVARLGCPLRLIRTRHQMGDREFPGWRGTLKLAPTNHWNARIDSEVVAIERSRARRFYDIGVKDDPHVFALASGVLTHNSKPNPMPESVAGWRWQRKRTKTGRETANWNVLPKGWDVGEGSHDVIGSGNYRGSDNRDHSIPRWEYGDDYELRTGSWRHTRAHEYVFMLVKKMGYWADQETVRDAGSGRRPGNRTYKYDGLEGHETKQGILAQAEIAQTTRNPRSVLNVPTSPYKGAHYATFPPNLIAPLILATCPRWCCPVCGQGWAPVVEQSYYNWADGNANAKRKGGSLSQERKALERRAELSSNVLGHRPTCDHPHAQEEALPGIVLDPFVGSGTTVAVARQLLRRGIGLDISRPYLTEQALLRTGLGAPTKFDDLPLFADGA